MFVLDENPRSKKLQRDTLESLPKDCPEDEAGPWVSSLPILVEPGKCTSGVHNWVAPLGSSSVEAF